MACWYVLHCPCWLVTDMILGLTQGFGILFGQLFGKKQWPLLRQVVTAAVVIGLGAGAVMTVLGLGTRLLGLLVSGNPVELEQLLGVGYEYLMVLVLSIPLMYLLCLYRSGLEGMGNVLMPTVSGFMELGLRILAVSYHRVYWQKSGIDT